MLKQLPAPSGVGSPRGFAIQNNTILTSNMVKTATTLGVMCGVWGVFLLPHMPPIVQAAGTLALAAATALVVATHVRNAR